MDRVDILGEDGAPYTIEYKGKTYRMSRLIGRVKAQWELHLRTRALSYLQDMKSEDLLPPDMYAAEIADYKEKLSHGGFSWGSETSKKLLETAEGSFDLAYFCFLEHQPELDKAEFLDIFVNKQREVQTGLQALLAPVSEAAKKNGRQQSGAQAKELRRAERQRQAKIKKTWGV